MDWIRTAFFGLCLALVLWNSGGTFDWLVGFAGALTLWSLAVALASLRKNKAKTPSWQTRNDWVNATRPTPPSEVSKGGELAFLALFAMLGIWLYYGIEAARAAAARPEPDWGDWLFGGLSVGFPLTGMLILFFLAWVAKREAPPPPFVLDTRPGRPGGELIGAIPIPDDARMERARNREGRQLADPGDFEARVALVCLERQQPENTTKTSARNVRQLWRSELDIRISKLKHWAQFSFELPDDALETSAVRPGSAGVLWRVELMSSTEGYRGPRSFEVPVFRAPKRPVRAPKPTVERRKYPVGTLSFIAAALVLVWWCKQPSPPKEALSCDQVFSGAELQECQVSTADAVFDPFVEVAECASTFAGYSDSDLRCVEAVAAAPVDVTRVVAKCRKAMRLTSYQLRCVEAASLTGGGASAVGRCSDDFNADSNIVKCLEDDAISFEKLRRLAEKGNPRAQQGLGRLYQLGRGVSRDAVEASKWYLKAAKQGLAKAQVSVAHAYYEGDGLPQSFEEAAAWDRKAAEQGYADGQYNLGTLYERGRGVSQDFATAAAWYRQAAQQGHVEAMLNLGNLHNEGSGVPRDFATAASWYRQAADRGNVQAALKLGLSYEEGRGVPQDSIEGIKWYEKAASRENAEGQWLLGRIYAEGRGVPQDFSEAYHYFRLAAWQGHAPAQYDLGVLYEHGRGIVQDSVLALQHYRKAAERGEPRAVAALERLGEPVPVPEQEVRTNHE